MAKPRVMILRAPGTNCDVETAYAFKLAGGDPERVHINRLLEEPALCDRFQILCVPGGFSYGDDVAAGRILGNQVLHHLADRMADFKAAGKLILGICNGFQVLMNSGVLLRSNGGVPAATLTWNDSGKFEDRWVRMGVEGDRSVFLRGVESLYLPVAHAEGKFVARDEAAFEELQAAGQLVLRYRLLGDSDDGDVPYPANPNGSEGHVAGICDPTGRVLGLMPHPERHIDPTHHPRWTRGETGEDGLAIFRNGVEYFA